MTSTMRPCPTCEYVMVVPPAPCPECGTMIEEDPEVATSPDTVIQYRLNRLGAATGVLAGGLVAGILGWIVGSVVIVPWILLLALGVSLWLIFKRS
jgi:hypothetical protein